MGASKRQVESAVERILASPELEHETRLARLLSFMVEQALEGKHDALSETLVGVQVFGRPADYDPKSDSVARAEVRRLRGKLVEYYSQSGALDEVRIELPKASFRPEFTTVAVVRERKSIQLPWRPVGMVAAVLAVVVGAVYWLNLPRGATVSASGHRMLSNQRGNSRTPAFSPDGERLVYSKEFDGRSSTLFVQDVSSGTTRALTFGDVVDSDPVWSPDGSRVAYLRQKEHNRFSVMVKDASNLARAESVAGVVLSRGGIDWTADGAALLVRVDRAIQKLVPGGGPMQALTHVEPDWVGDSDPRSSPDGKWIAFVREKSEGAYELMLMSAQGGEPKPLAASENRIAGFCWTPDSSHLVASLDRKSLGRNLWLVPIYAGEMKRIESAGLGAMTPAMPRRANGLAFVVRLVDTNVWSVVPGKGNGAPITVIPESDGAPQLSPDGKRLAWRSAASGINEIWVADANGSRPSQLTKMGAGRTGSPAWSPDGNSIVFESNPNGQSDLFVIAASGGEPRPLVQSNADEVVPFYSRDGRSVYFSSNADGGWSLIRAPLAGGPAIVVEGNGAFAGQESPDGRWIYFTRRGQEAGGVWRKPIGGGSTEMLVAELSSRFWGQWAVSAKGLFYSIFPGSGTQAIRRLDLDTRQLSDVVTLNHLPETFERGMSVTSDERLLVWSQLDRSGSDVYIVDGFRAP